MAHPTVRSLEYWAYQYKRTWRGGVVTSFLSPVLFLAAMGVGLGGLVHSATAARGLHGVSYLVFLAPGLLAANAMQVAVQESTYPVMGAIKWIRTYHAMLATPLRVIDVLLGHLLWIALRILMVCAIFLGVMAAFGTTKSWTAVFLLPAGLLTGVAFAAPVVAFAATRDNDSGFNALFRFGVMPLFLFSGTFFPLSTSCPAVCERWPTRRRCGTASSCAARSRWAPRSSGSRSGTWRIWPRWLPLARPWRPAPIRRGC